MPTSKNYYTLLGVEKSASKDEIKRAFHKLARKYHPDNKETGNEQKFKDINEAYHTLSDDQKRAEYDAYGHVFSGMKGGERYYNSSGFDFSDAFGKFYQEFSSRGGSTQGPHEFDLGDIFSEFFGGQDFSRRKKRGRDISIDLTIPFYEAIYGTERAVLITKTGLCITCEGSGSKPRTSFIKCTTCNGQGKIHDSRNSFFGTFTSIRECGECHGEGRVPKEKCKTCNGAGIVRRQEEITIKIPAGIQEGEVIRLSGMGEAVMRGISGDLYVKIHVQPHSTFKREGKNLVMNLDIKLSDALLGAIYTITTLDGKTVELKIPKGISYSEILRIKGKGIPVEGGTQGDLLVKITINLPKNLSEKAERLLEDLKKEGV